MRFKAKLAPEQLTVFYNVVTPMARIASTSSSGSSGGGGGGGTQRRGGGGAPLSTSVWTRNSCILHLDSNYARLYCKGRSMETDQVQCYAEFTAAAAHSSSSSGGPAIFVDYRIESAAEGNAICMELDLAQLRLALQSLAMDKKQSSSNQSAFGGLDPHYSTTVLKLAKRNNIPCLCLDAFTTGDGGMPIQVHHSISVRILRLADMVHFRPPQFDRLRTADVVQLELPPDRPLRTVMEGLKVLSGGSSSHQSSSRSSSSSSSSGASVTLRATTNGELTISLDSDGASIRTYFHHLPAVATSDGGNDNDDDHDDDGSTNDRSSQTTRQRRKRKAATTTARVRVDAKKLCSCLQWQQQSHGSSSGFPIHRAVLCLVENEVLLVHVDLHPAGVGHQTYYVPVRYMNPEDDESTTMGHRRRSRSFLLRKDVLAWRDSQQDSWSLDESGVGTLQPSCSLTAERRQQRR